MVRNRAVKIMLAIVIFYCIGLTLALLTQKLVVQPNSNSMANCEMSSDYIKYIEEQCPKYPVETRGWPFPSIKKFQNGSESLIVTSDCINPFEIFCGKSPGAAHYVMRQLYINAALLGIMSGGFYYIGKKIKGKYAHPRD